MALTKAKLIANNSATAAVIAANTVGSSEIAQNSVTSVQIPNNSLGTTQVSAAMMATKQNALGSGDVTSAMIANNSVTIAKLAVTDGTSGQVLKTDGSGTLSFGTSTSTTINNNADNRLITGSGTANTLEGEANLIWNGTKLGVGTTSPQAHLDINTETAEATTVILNGEANQDKILKFRHYANSEAAGDGYAGFIGSVVDNVLTLGHYNSSNSEVQVLNVTEGGLVGIGTDSPSHGLTVSDSVLGSSASRRITIKSTTHGVNAGYRFDTESANGTARSGGTYYTPSDTSGASYIGLTGDDANAHLVVTDAGKVGMGLTSPQGPLHVQSGTNETIIADYTAADGTGSFTWHSFRRNNANDFRIFGTLTANQSQLGIYNDQSGGTYPVVITHDDHIGILDQNPKHHLKVTLASGEVAMFGGQGTNNQGAYCGIGLGQHLAGDTTYQKVSLVYEGRGNGSYLGNFHVLVDTASDSGSAVLADSKLMISGVNNGYMGVHMTDPRSRAEFHLDQVAASTNVNAGSTVHFGSQQHTNGAMMGITLGYREASMNYRKVGLVAIGRGDNAARQDFAILVDTANDAYSVRDSDAKLRIHGTSGVCTIGSSQAQSDYYCLVVQTSNGYGRQGSHNSSYFHHETDRAYFYWNEAGYFAGGAHTYSDEKLKKDVVVIPNALDSVAKMNGVTFKWKDPEKRASKETGTGKQFGVIAQNMLEVDPELPTLSVDPLAESGNEETDDKLYSMDYARLSPYFIEAIKELKTKLEAAEARIAELEG